MRLIILLFVFLLINACAYQPNTIVDPSNKNKNVKTSTSQISVEEITKTIDFKSVEDSLKKANDLYEQEKAEYKDYISDILSENGMIGKYSDAVMQDLGIDMDNFVIDTGKINNSIEKYSKDFDEIIGDIDFGEIVDGNEIKNFIGDLMDNKNSSYGQMTDKYKTILNNQFCDSETGECDMFSINENLEKLKDMLPLDDFNIMFFDEYFKQATKVQIAGNCACNSFMDKAYSNMSDFVAGDNLGQIPSKIDAAITAVQSRIALYKNDNSILDAKTLQIKNEQTQLMKYIHLLEQEISLLGNRN